MSVPTADSQSRPWYREFWPWFVFGLVGVVVIASIVTLVIALNYRDPLVVEPDEYDRIRGALRADDAQEGDESGDERD